MTTQIASKMSGLKKASRTKSLSLSDDFPLRAATSRPKKSFLQKTEDITKIFKYIDDNVIGKGVAFYGPYGRRKSKDRLRIACSINDTISTLNSILGCAFCVHCRSRISLSKVLTKKTRFQWIAKSF